jgi:dihydrofolate reductase
MRKLVAYELLSLDGVAEDPLDYVTEFDELMRENLARVIARQDAVLLGRRTYDDWAAFWPTSDIEPFASFINGVAKFVVTGRPLEERWMNTTAASAAAVELVAGLKRQAGGDIGLHGSITLTQSLLAAGLVDELRLVIAPAWQGRGRRLLDGASPARLSLTRCVSSPCGYLLVDYELAH